MVQIFSVGQSKNDLGCKNRMSRPPRILWATRYCLIDHTSGAALSAREMLCQLASRGWEVEVIGATVFETGGGPPEIRTRLDEIETPGTLVRYSDGPLKHIWVKTESPQMRDMRIHELDKLLVLYLKRLEEWQPDIVWLYGGKTFELLALGDAKRSGAATAFFLVNGNYKGKRWHQDVDVILTDSQATSELYKKTQGIHPQPIGKFIRRQTVVPLRHERSHVTFVNPKPEKGAYLVAQMAMALEHRRPDIQFEVVESRGTWGDIVRRITARQGQQRDSLLNVLVTPNTTDMRPVYGRSRVVLSPSLWWESGNRVLVEAMLNGIPAIVTNRGGPPEMIGDGGIAITLPEIFHKPPYSRLLPPDALALITGMIEQMYDDEAGYQSMVREAVKAGEERHDIERNTDRLIEQLSNLMRIVSSD